MSARPYSAQLSQQTDLGDSGRTRHSAFMKASLLFLIVVLSHLCRAQALFSASSSRSRSDSCSRGSSAGCPPYSGTDSDRPLLERDGNHSEGRRRRRRRRSWLLTRGGASSANGEKEPNSRWWRSRKRRAKRQSEIAAREAAQDALHRSVPLAKHLVLVQGVLRQLKRWLGFIVDITTLKRLRLLRRARQGSWQHGGPIPVRYRGLLQELRQEVAAKPDLEKRAKRVHHELDTIALGRYLEAAFWALERDGKRVSTFIEESIAWREMIGADRLQKEDVIVQGEKGSIIVKGHDLSRRPVVYFRLAIDGRMEGDGNLKLMIFSLERAIRLMPRNSWQYTIVLDCQGMGLKQMPPVAHVKKMFKLLSHHYPMRLGHVLFTNVGPSVMLCWKVVSPLLQARTKAKMHLIPSMKLAQTEKYIHPSQLLPFAGGKSAWQFDPAVYFSNDAASL